MLRYKRFCTEMYLSFQSVEDLSDLHNHNLFKLQKKTAKMTDCDVWIDVLFCFSYRTAEVSDSESAFRALFLAPVTPSGRVPPTGWARENMCRKKKHDSVNHPIMLLTLIPSILGRERSGCGDGGPDAGRWWSVPGAPRPWLLASSCPLL